MNCLGIDPSTKTGLVLIGPGCVVSRVLKFPDTKGLTRVQSIADAFDDFLDESPAIDCAAVEGYGYASFNLSTSVEIGVFLRMSLHKRGVPWYTVPPTVLKKFATGSGISKKPAIAAAVKTRWGFESPSDDVVDAYVLAVIAGMVAANGVKSVSLEIQRG